VGKCINFELSCYS